MPATTEKRRRHSLVAAALSALLPGLGDVYGGRWRRGVVLVAASATIAMAAMVAWRLDAARILELAVQPKVLWIVLLANLAVGVFRLFVVADAFRSLRRPAHTRLGRIMLAAAATGVLGLTAAPHVIAGAYTVDALDLLTTVFDTDGEAAAADGVLAKIQGPIIEVVPRIYIHRPPDEWRPYEDPPPSGRFPLQAIQAVPPFDTEGLDDGRITILLAGGDAGPGRGGLRTDSMMVASLDTETGTAAIFGLPRDLFAVPLPKILADTDAFAEYYDLECECFLNRLNAVYPFGRKTGLFSGEEDRGMKALEITVERLLDLPIDYYMLVDMGGFVDVVDALGGVKVNVKTPVIAEVSPYEEGGEWISIELEPGRQRLDGPEALAYVRERKSSSDYTRMQRQRCMLQAVAAEASPSRMLRVFPRVSAAIKRSTRTNIPLGILPDLVSTAAGLRSEDITTLGFVPTYYVGYDEELGKPVPEVDRIRRAVRAVLGGNPPPTRLSGAGEC